MYISFSAYANVRNKKAVTAYYSSEQFLGFAEHITYVHEKNVNLSYLPHVADL